MAMRETMTQISNPLLNTKLFIPRSRPDLIPSVRLTGLLQAGAWRALTLVSRRQPDLARRRSCPIGCARADGKPRGYLTRSRRRNWSQLNTGTGEGCPPRVAVIRHLLNIFLKTGVPNMGYPIDYPSSRIG